MTTKILLRGIRRGLLLATGAIVLVYFVFSLLPSDPARAALGERQDPDAQRIIRHDFATDQPFYNRFLIYLNDLLPVSIYNRKEKESPIYLDKAKYRDAFKVFYFGEDKTVVFKMPYLRRSYQSRAAVSDMITGAFKSTAVLVSTAIVIAVIFGIGLGILAAIKRNSWIDKFISSFAMLGTSLPVFFTAIIIAWLFGYVLNKYTGLTMNGGLYSIDPFEGEYINWKNLILPSVVLAIRPASFFTMQARQLFLDVLNKNYILTAKAKGARRSSILLHHTWINSTSPLLLLSEKWLGALLAGTVFTEFIFGWNGIGKMAVNAINNADMPVLMGTTLVITLIYIFLNSISWLIFSTIDPRVDQNLVV